MRIPSIILAIALAAAPALAQDQVADLSARLELAQDDSLLLVAEFFPSNAEEAPTALVLPDRGAQRQPLRILARLAQEKGYSTLLPDLRGQGGSRFPGGGPSTPHAFGPLERQRMARDLDSLLDFGQRQENSLGREGVVFAVGESWTLGLDLLLRRPEMRRLYLISPLQGQLGLELPELPEGREVFLVSCEEDEVARVTQMQIYLLLPEGARRQLLLPGRSRGPGMLRQQPELRRQISDWLER